MGILYCILLMDFSSKGIFCIGEGIVDNGFHPMNHGWSPRSRLRVIVIESHK